MLFLFYWGNDNVPRFKRGARSFSVLAAAVTAFVVLFVYIHQDEAFQSKDKTCPPLFDYSKWLLLHLAVGVRPSPPTVCDQQFVFLFDN